MLASRFAEAHAGLQAGGRARKGNDGAKRKERKNDRRALPLSMKVMTTTTAEILYLEEDE